MTPLVKQQPVGKACHSAVPNPDQQGKGTGKLNVSYTCPESQETRSANARDADLSKSCSYMQED